MERKRLIAQILAAVLLYTLISLTLEKDWSRDGIIKEFGEGLIFGLVYGIFIYFREQRRRKKDS